MDSHEKCVICGEDVSVVTNLNAPDFHLSCMTSLKVHRKAEFEKRQATNNSCRECGKSVFIQYNAHPGLHSTCWTSWKENNPGQLYPFSPLSQFEFNEQDVLNELRLQNKNRSKQELPASSSPATIVPDDSPDEVERILSSKDFYDVLLVTRQEHTDDQFIELVKRQYKKMALKIHPDKNPHPESAKAFNLLSEAMNCLTDAQTKQRYDQLILDISNQQKIQQAMVALGLYEVVLKQLFKT